MAEPIFAFQPIGVIHTPFARAAGTPIQARATRERGHIDIRPAYAEGLTDLEGFSHVYLLYVLDRMDKGALKVTPFLDGKEHGVFATRSPKRPNPIGLSIVQLLTIEGTRLTFEGADMLDGTPLLDIKPYVPDFDHFQPTRIGWYEHRLRKDECVLADDRFERKP
ncbi:MAG: tRNA (N6-threonylcarbamoyladenosine(37)-N6)-methyltransferase TrmO [Candidatus Riflebacteria bacterium]|nr:tRNA (N6-threonylcarbamoyladenosine(37)-N6)-methyltransferase TrmO [Candidatus Riflebacteria bacterium]